MSFSGEGHDIWQNPDPADKSAAAQHSFVDQPDRRWHNREPIFVPIYPGFGFGPYWGFGLGFDFGPGCDPFYAWGFGCPGFLGAGFDDGAYGYNYGYWGDFNSEPDQANPDAGDMQEPLSLEPQAAAPSVSAVPMQQTEAPNYAVLYFVDGSSLAVADYWVSGGMLHYITMYGGQNAASLKFFDLQRTTDENAKQGITITLHNAPMNPNEAPANPQTQANPNAPPQNAPVH